MGRPGYVTTIRPYLSSCANGPVSLAVRHSRHSLHTIYQPAGGARGRKTRMGGAIAVESAQFVPGFRGFFAWNLALILLGIIVIAVFWFPW